MVVIAIMPAARIMISFAKLIAISGGDLNIIVTIARVMETIG